MPQGVNLRSGLITPSRVVRARIEEFYDALPISQLGELQQSRVKPLAEGDNAAGSGIEPRDSDSEIRALIHCATTPLLIGARKI